MADIEEVVTATWIARMDDEPQECELLYIEHIRLWADIDRNCNTFFATTIP